jgi:hypothetical protein
VRLRRHKAFEFVSEDGWKSANKRVIRNMLESETETSRPDIRPTSSPSPDNYQFQMLGSESLEGRPVCVIQVLPKREDKHLFEGRIWVDAFQSHWCDSKACLCWSASCQRETGRN